MKKLLAAALLLSVSHIAVAQAEEAASPYGTFSANVGFVSDYRYRGVTQTSENMAIQGGMDWSHDSGLYLGVWGSNVNFKDGGEADIEADVYGGYKFEFSGLSLDMGLLGYFYPGADSNLNYDYYEAKIAVAKDFGNFNLGASVNYSPENFGDSGDETYMGLTASAPIMDTGLTASASYGYQWIDDEVAFGLPDYSDWSLGVSYEFQGFNLGLKYVDTDLSKTECGDNCDATAIFSVSRSF
jgi:uncharacterized protein (TIGR02001 family)